MNKTWSLFRCSPVCGLGFSENERETYVKELTELFSTDFLKSKHYVIDHLGDEEVLESRGNVEGRDRLSNVKCSIRLDNFEVALPFGSFQIDIFLSPSRKPSVSALFCFLESSRKNSDRFRSFPLVLRFGRSESADRLFSWFETRFSCIFDRLMIDSSFLRSFVVHMTHWDVIGHRSVSETGRHPMELVLRFPENVAKIGVQTMTISLPREELFVLHSQLLSTRSPAHEDSIYVEEFFKLISSHVSYHLSLSLDSLSIVSVSSSAAKMDIQADLKLFSPTFVEDVVSTLLSRAESIEY